MFIIVFNLRIHQLPIILLTKFHTFMFTAEKQGTLSNNKVSYPIISTNCRGIFRMFGLVLTSTYQTNVQYSVKNELSMIFVLLNFDEIKALFPVIIIFSRVLFYMVSIALTKIEKNFQA